MHVQYHVKEENPKILVITVDGKGYKEVSLSFFKKALAALPIDLPNYTEIDEWFFSLEVKLAKRYVFFLLAQRSYPQGMLRKKLNDKKISCASIDLLMADLENWGYLNDDEWISHFVDKEIRKGYGPLIIRMKLKEKKIEEDKICDFLKSLYSEKKERKAIAQLLEKRYSSIDLTEPKEKQRLFAKMQRRGFSPSLIIQVVDLFMQNSVN